MKRARRKNTELQSKSYSKWYLVVLVVLQLALGLSYLGNIPRVFVDEAWDSALGWNLAHSDKLAHPFIQGMGGMDICFVQPRVILAMASAAFFKFSDCTIFAGRLPSVGFSVIAVICLYLLVKRWFGSGQAFLSCLLMITQAWFFEISRRARPEIYYTALAVLLLLMIDNYYRRPSKLNALFVGIITALTALTHVNGVILIISVFISTLIWIRPKRLGVYFVFTCFGGIITCLPYLIYLIWASHQPGVDFSKQMHAGVFQGSVIIKELSRYKHFLIFPKFLPVGVIMFFTWVTAWFSASKYEKLFVTAITLFALILPIASINPTPHYFAATIPFWSVLVIRFFRELLKEPYLLEKYNKTRTAFVVLLIAIYVLPSLYVITDVFYKLRKADFNKVVAIIAEKIPTGAKVYGDPIFWYNQGKLNYGPYMISYKGMVSSDVTNWAQDNNFEYAIRNSWKISPPFWGEKVHQKRRGFDESLLWDYLCKRHATKVDEFCDPYYGLVEIYKFNWPSQKNIY